MLCNLSQYELWQHYPPSPRICDRWDNIYLWGGGWVCVGGGGGGASATRHSWLRGVYCLSPPRYCDTTETGSQGVFIRKISHTTREICLVKWQWHEDVNWVKLFLSLQTDRIILFLRQKRNLKPLTSRQYRGNKQMYGFRVIGSKILTPAAGTKYLRNVTVAFVKYRTSTTLSCFFKI